MFGNLPVNKSGQWKKGDKVVIKDYYRIFEDNIGLLFLPIMKPYCGMTLTLDKQTTPQDAGLFDSGRVWRLKGIKWLWHENWFEQPNVFLKDEDFEL